MEAFVTETTAPEAGNYIRAADPWWAWEASPASALKIVGTIGAMVGALSSNIVAAASGNIAEKPAKSLQLGASFVNDL